MEASKSEVPTARVQVLKGTAVLVAGQRAHQLIEAVTGMSLWAYLMTLRGKKPREIPLTRWLPLLWGLTATERAATGERHVLTQEDREHGLIVPSSFSETLPTGPAWFNLVETADRLLREAWSDEKPGAKTSGNL